MKYDKMEMITYQIANITCPCIFRQMLIEVWLHILSPTCFECINVFIMVHGHVDIVMWRS